MEKNKNNKHTIIPMGIVSVIHHFVANVTSMEHPGAVISGSRLAAKKDEEMKKKETKKEEIV
jgi:hypothetical protein|tara:strand:+ start:302 stop:487 length:186 start_codon:yes stop_codon:yes gene_type:complete